MAPSGNGMVWIAGGAFAMGSNAHYADERPAHRVTVDGFWIDRTPVTNAEFETFVAATGYRTVAERPVDPDLAPGVSAEALAPGSAVFVMSDGPINLDDWSQWWAWVPGADWRHPEGPGSGIRDREDHPVVHVCHADALAYCAWAGKELPGEAEWEYAARGGLDGAEFVWGEGDLQESAPLANTWQGGFPYENTELDGWTRTSPVDAFPPNGYGLRDMAGNVWEWTDDRYARRHAPGDDSSCCAPATPRGDDATAIGGTWQPEADPLRKVIKGGSHLCTIQYCFRYRPAARQAQTPDTGLSNLGFRCILRGRTPGEPTPKLPSPERHG